MFYPSDREFFFYFSPDLDIYQSHYSQFHNILDLNETKAQYIQYLRENYPKNPKEAKELYKKALSSKKKLITASNPNPFRTNEGLNEEDLLNIHLICADAIDSEPEQLSIFRRVAKAIKSDTHLGKIYLRIKALGKFN